MKILGVFVAALAVALECPADDWLSDAGGLYAFAKRARISVAYANGSGIAGSGYEIEDGYIHLITAITPGKTDREGFIEAVLTQRYLLDRSIEYLKDESKQVKELNLRKIITALLS